MRQWLLGALVGAIGLGAGAVTAPGALAGIFELPGVDAVVTIDLPDDWKVMATPDSLQTVTPDDVEARFVVTSPDAASTLVAALTGGDQKRGVTVDRSSEDRDDRHIAAREAVDVSYRTGGRLPGRLRIVRMDLVPGKVLVMSFLGTESALDAADAAIEGIFNGLKVLDN